jgi:hypothetical protein
MADIVPNTFENLRDAIIKKWESLDPFLMKLEAEHSFDACAARDGHGTIVKRDVEIEGGGKRLRPFDSKTG